MCHVESYEKFISSVEKELRKPLPGISAQYKMAPHDRIERVAMAHISGEQQTSAVLILIFPENEIPTICFIRRQDYPGVHSGQISFPGGKNEKKDPDLWNTAIRETNEETGVKVDQIKYIGKLTPLYIPVSNFWVHPFVGYLLHYPQFKMDKSEVKYILKAPFTEITKPEIIEKSRQNTESKKEVPCYNYKGETIWGATAMILCEFLEITSQILPDRY
ncbi:MAG: CoA pyrophosphatase [Candidatus Neomarinimicrobiota bacterium]